MDKINIRDLRVGNWVTLYHPSQPKKNIQLSGDWIRHVERIYDGFITEDSPLYRIIEPIPLTSGILENSGFVKRQPKIGENKNCLGTWFNSKTVTTVKEYFIDREHSIFMLFGGYSKIGNIKFVHQFQNALRDCGIDKEITI